MQCWRNRAGLNRLQPDIPMLDSIDSVRLSVAGRTAPGRKSALGQFFTPASTARFMAGLFEAKECEQARLLDAGAGIGSLSAAFAERREGLGIRQLHIEAFEQDESIHQSCSRP